jgi:hypothetical protein
LREHSLLQRRLHTGRTRSHLEITASSAPLAIEVAVGEISFYNLARHGANGIITKHGIVELRGLGLDPHRSPLDRERRKHRVALVEA